MKKIVCFTGGGTAGHVFPGLAVLGELKRAAAGAGQDIEFLWLTSRGGMENALLEQEGVARRAFFSGKLRRYFSLQNFFDLFKIFIGFLQSFFFFLPRRRALLFSKGGFVGVCPAAAAGLLGVPVYIHESDADPGLATRLAAPFARRILLSLPETRSYFSPAYQSRITVTGNPVRPEMDRASPSRGRRLLGLDQDKPLLLILGGSQGAREINRLAAEVVPSLIDRGAAVVHQTGRGDSPPQGGGFYHVRAFIGEELPDLMAAADLVLSRAGAATLWELASLQKPMLLLPLGLAGSRGDQIKNAGIFESRGMARIFSGGPEKLLEELTGLLLEPRGRETLAAMSRACREFLPPGKTPAAQIAEILLGEINETGH